MTFYESTKIDELVKNRKCYFSVIPAKAGIQYFKPVIKPLDPVFSTLRSKLLRRTGNGVTTFYERIKIGNYIIILNSDSWILASDFLRPYLKS